MRRENLSGKKVYNDIKRRFVRNIIVIFLLSDLKILGTVKAIFFTKRGFTFWYLPGKSENAGNIYVGL